jgi:hypothetical protein
MDSIKKWDVFISHASEDKDILVRLLAKQLTEVYKVKVWYDEFALEYGDSLLDSIEKGLQYSDYGVVIFSKSFFDKVWTDHEYKSLRTKEMLLNKKIIIPIWYNITREKVASYSLILADKYAITLNEDINSNIIDDLAMKLIKVIRPDIYDNIARMSYFESILKNSKKGRVDVEKIPTPPVRHETISVHMRARLKLVYNTIKEVDYRTYEMYEEDFRRSTNIDRELIITELLSAAYIDCLKVRNMTFKEKSYIYSVIMICSDFRNNELGFTQNEVQLFNSIVEKYTQNIEAIVVMEYKFDV